MAAESVSGADAGSATSAFEMADKGVELSRQIAESDGQQCGDQCVPNQRCDAPRLASCSVTWAAAARRRLRVRLRERRERRGERRPRSSRSCVQSE